MKRMLMRPSAAFFPVVGMISALVGSAEATAALFFFYCCLQALGFCAADCFRNAAGREPGVRRVDKRFGGAIVQLLIGFALAAAGMWLLWDKMQAYSGAFIAAGCICIEHLFEERNFALGRSLDGVMISGISNVLLLAGLLMDGEHLLGAWLQSPALYTAAAGAVISVITSYAVEKPRGFSLVPRNLGFAPKAMVQALLYPAAAVALAYLMGVLDHAYLAPALYGLLIWRLARTNCRRSADESRSLNLLLMALTAVPIIAMAWIDPLPGWTRFAVLAMLCAVAVYAAPGWRIYVGAASMLAVLLCLIFLPLQPMVCSIVATGFALAAVIFNLKHAFLKKI